MGGGASPRRRGRVPEADSLGRNLREADAVVERDDRERYAELVREFHDLFMVGSDNGRLQAHYRILMHQLVYSRLVNTSPGRPGRATSRRALPAGLPIADRQLL